MIGLERPSEDLVFLLGAIMTALVDFPVTETPDPRDPAVVAALARTLNYVELQVALHASGAELGAELYRDLPSAAALVEIGLASIGIDAVRATGAELREYGIAATRELQEGRSGLKPATAYARALGGKRRADRCCGLASSLCDYYRP